MLYEDVEENHGRFVTTRGRHQLRITGPFRMARYLVTHELFQRFVADGGYEEDRYWPIPRPARQQFVTADGHSLGPASWPDACTIPRGKEQHPVSAVSFLEAQAFIHGATNL